MLNNLYNIKCNIFIFNKLTLLKLYIKVKC